MSAKTDTGDGDASHFPAHKTVQVDGITDGTVVLKGSNDGVTYHDIVEITADGLYDIDSPFAKLKPTVTVATDVSVTVTVGYEV
jgi:hypothetical protein